MLVQRTTDLIGKPGDLTKGLPYSAKRSHQVRWGRPVLQFMNVRTFGLTTLFAIALTPFAQAQLVTKTFTVVGQTNLSGTYTTVSTQFTMWLNVNANTLAININNNLSVPNGNALVGTLVSFGFNTPNGWLPLSDASVAVKEKWTKVNTGHTGLPTASWGSDDFWQEHAPYDLSPDGYDQDFGVSTPGGGTSGNPGLGIQYGEKASFVFTFTNDITVSNLAGFFDNSASTAHDYDFTVRWQQVSSKSAYLEPCDEDLSAKGGLDLAFLPTGEIPATPEPSTYGLIGAVALVGLALRRRYKARIAVSASATS